MKTIFITGASTGLGKTTAKLFQSRGWNVIATMRNPEAETELNQLENVVLLPLDVTNLEQIQTTVKKALEYSDIDLVFNNAGYGLIGPLEALHDDQILKQLDTNLLGVIRVTKEFIPYFRERKSGMFITTTSIGGLIAFPLSSTYHATKWGFEGWRKFGLRIKYIRIDIKTVSPEELKPISSAVLWIWEHNRNIKP
jgi:NADP-dependent 3-hydroxy acid dehydrogenase YdfG